MRIFYLLGTLFLLGCASTAMNKSNELKLIKKISIGDDRSQVVKVLGTPFSTESESNGYEKLVYTQSYKGHQLPKVIIWLDKQNQVALKYINLFSESDGVITVDRIEDHFGDLNLKIEPLDLSERHYIPSERTLRDLRAGISIQINNTEERRVQNITWFEPEKRSSASEE